MAVEALGVVSGLMGIFSFVDTYFGQPDTSDDTNIQLAVAVDGNGGTSSGGGDLPDVRLFNVYGEFIGMTADPGSVGDGEVGTVTVTGDSAQQTPYTLFSANDDAICIAYATTTWPDQQKYWWDGSFGEVCGATWYYSGIYYQEANYKPNCAWIDANGDQPDTGFQLSFPYFADTSLDGASASDVCGTWNYNRYQDEDPNTIIYDANPNGKRGESTVATSEPAAPAVKSRKQRARDFQKRNKSFASHLIVSNADHHNVTALCTSETSAGPDFVNKAEGLFCDMQEKTVYTLCGSDAAETPCFDADTKTLVGEGIQKRALNYNRVQDWSF